MASIIVERVERDIDGGVLAFFKPARVSVTNTIGDLTEIRPGYVRV